LKTKLLQHWPLYVSVLILSLLFGLLLATSFYQNQGHLVYALDDAYIHMAMARNFSLYGVWGITRYGFASSSSSILWTLLLSFTYYLFGVSQIAPLLWNLLFAVLVLWVAYAILTHYKLAPALKLAALLAIIFLIPLPALILSGMEQNLQTLLALLATFLAARVLSGEAPSTAARDSTLLLVLAPLVTAVRFEGMFLILAICGLLLLRKRWFYALAFVVCGFLPVVIYGIISVSHGWFWLPSSVLLKGVTPDLRSLSGLFLSLAINAFVNLHLGLHVFVLLIAVLLFYVLACGKGRGVFDSRQIMGAILLVTAIPHVEFVQVSPLFRYDAYHNARLPTSDLFQQGVGSQESRRFECRPKGRRYADFQQRVDSQKPCHRCAGAPAFLPFGRERHAAALVSPPMHDQHLRTTVSNGVFPPSVLPRLSRRAE
jgi:hypothetical protein